MILILRKILFIIGHITEYKYMRLQAVTSRFQLTDRRFRKQLLNELVVSDELLDNQCTKNLLRTCGLADVEVFVHVQLCIFSYSIANRV